jgi:DNA-binding CsgD family transcriptional regulator
MTALNPPQPTSKATTLSLVGRVAEQRALRERLRAALEGRGGLVLIGGEAGIGKTTLVDWLAAEACAEGVQVLTGHCYDLTPAPPYGPWHEAFATSAGTSQPHPLPDGAQPGEIASQAALFTQMRAYLERLATGRPILIILEDLHWADPASLDLLRDLARVLDRIGVLLLATYRVDELTRQHPLALLLPHLVREARSERIDPARFSAEDIQALLCERYPLSLTDEARLVHYLSARSGGNPFFLDELLRMLEGSRLLQLEGERWRVGDLGQAAVPPLVRQIIEQRLLQLQLETQRLLEVAAIIGQEVALHLWQAAGDATDDRLALAAEEAIAARLLIEAPGGPSVRFSHALVQETLVARQPLLRRRATHRRVAELLTVRPQPPVSLVASHFASADDPRAITWLARAGAQALALYAARDAVAALTRAHELASRLAEPLPASAYYDRAAAYALLGEFDNARHDYELVLERSRAAGDHAAEWQALLDLGMLWSERDYERTGSYYSAALDLARQIGDEPTVARSLNRVANWQVNREEPDLAIPLHQEALSIFERHGDRAGIADTLDLLGMAAYLSGNYSASTDYRERAIAQLRALGDRVRLSSCLTNLGLTGGGVDIAIEPTFREAAFWLRAMEEGLQIAQEIGWTAGEAFAHYCLSLMTRAHGNLGQALLHAAEAERLARQIGHQQWTIAAHQGWATLWLELLQPERAAAAWEEALATARGIGSRFWITLTTGGLSSSLIASVQLDRAAALLDSLPPAGPPRTLGQQLRWLAQVELLLARGDPERALVFLDLLTGGSPGAGPASGAPLALKLRGDAFVQLQRHEEAERSYLAGRQSATLYGFRPLAWRIDEAHGRLIAAQGRAAEAAAAFQRGLACIEQMAATIPDEKIREGFLARARQRFPEDRPYARHAPTATPLSPREQDVLRLIVDGLSDREIAASLSISPRTVMRHVTGILTKLDVTSRTAAATLAIRQELV